MCIAYTLAIEAVMASVGLGMSAVAAPGQTGFVICSFVGKRIAPATAGSGGPQNPAPRPQCPFCFVAAQTAGQAATVGNLSTLLAYVERRVIATVSDRSGGEIAIAQPRRWVGNPRAPPAFSV